MYWNERCGVCGCLPGGLNPPEEGRGRLCGGGPVVHRSGGVHRQRRVRAGVPGVGDLRGGRSAGEVGRLPGQERCALRAVKQWSVVSGE